jgi:hypothetical protein
MSRDYEPYPDPEKPKRYRAPKALARLRAKFSYDRQVKEFRRVFGRDPASDGELDVFVETFTLEMYNDGFEEIPDRPL